MFINREYFFLFLLTISTLLPKWIIAGSLFDNSIIVNTIFLIKDSHYFPLVLSLSDLTLNPSYLENLSDNKLLTFPLYSIFFHSLFFKIFHVYSFIILEFIFQFIFLIIFFKTINRIFSDTNFSLYFCFFIFFIIFCLQITLFYDQTKYLQILFDTLDQNLGSRFPRPLITGIILFYFFYILFNFKDKLEKFDLKYFVLLVFLLSVFLNSFFYYFLNFSLLLIFMFFRYKNLSFIKFLKNQKKNISIVILSFIIFTFPFLLQIYFGEIDYSKRIGVIEINFSQKLFLLKYYFLNFLRIESVLMLIFIFLIHIYINKKYDNFNDQIFKLNTIFYFVLASIISPPIFFLFSPKLISIYHFLGILIFIIIFYSIISLSFILSKNFKIGDNYYLKIILLIFIFLFNTYIGKINSDGVNLEINELQNIQNFFQNQKLKNTNDKLFTNDRKIMNLWLLNDNKQLIISDGFTNSLKNKDIEFNLINNLKNFEISIGELKQILSFEKSEFRNDFFMRLFNYRYQANSLYTYSKIENYLKENQKMIVNTSPFRVQQQIMPEDEKKRLVLLFENIKLDKNLFSDIVIINKKISLNNFKIHNKKYNLLYSSDIYDIYKLN